MSNAPTEDDDLELLLLQCLDAANPAAELARLTTARPELRARAEPLLRQVQSFEELEPVTSCPAPVTDDPATWPQLPDLALDAILGRGGQGLVFRGRQVYLDRVVAVKVLGAEWRTPAFVERFRREARMLAGLQHRHVVACFQAGVSAAGDCFLVMELLEGPTLRAHVEQRGRLPVATALRVARDLAMALEHANGIGLVHRDVKPENVLLQPSPDANDGAFPFVAKLADFGLARPVARGGAGFTRLTPVGAVLGTPNAMAPEQFDAPDRVDHRADIYGLGCVLHFMLAGKPAFRGYAVTELVVQKAAMRGDARVTIDAVPESVCALLTRMLACDPGERPQDYRSLIAEMDTLLAAAEASTAPPRRRRWPWLVAALVMVSAGVGLAKLWLHADEPQTPRVTAPALPPLGAGETRGLFATSGDTQMAGWTDLEAQRWGMDESGRGAIVNSSRGRTEARHLLPAGAFTFSGHLEPRRRGDGERIAEVGVRILFGGDDALALLVTPDEVASPPFRVRACLQRRGSDGSWSTRTELGTATGEFATAAPLAFTVTWEGRRLTGTVAGFSFDTTPERDWAVPNEPTALVVHAERGVAVFTDWQFTPPVH